MKLSRQDSCTPARARAAPLSDVPFAGRGSANPVGLLWDPWLVFERFTERARVVIVMAQEEASTLRHNYIGTEHILLGLLREEQGHAARVLGGLGVTLGRVRELVLSKVSAGQGPISGQIPFTPRAKKVLERALHEALSLGHDHIDTEHLLLGLVDQDEGVAIGVLLELGAHTETIRGQVLAALSVPGARSPRPTSWTPPSARVFHQTEPVQPVLDWRRASLLWRPEGLELRVPLHLDAGAIAAFAGDAAWSAPPLQGMRREIWDGWLALASPSLLDATDPVELRGALDGVAKRALEGSGREAGRVQEFLRRLQDASTDA